MQTKSEGMMTKVWGPTSWIFLHSVTFGYPEQIDENNKDHINRKKNMKTFFNSLVYVLPCNLCRESSAAYLRQTPIESHLNSRRDLVRWLYNFHNLVNKKLGTPKCDIPSFKEFCKFYENFRASCKPTTEKQKLENSKGCTFPKKGYRKKRSLIRIVNNDKLTCNYCGKCTENIKMFGKEQLCEFCRNEKQS